MQLTIADHVAFYQDQTLTLRRLIEGVDQMKFHIAHANLNVLNMDRSLAFYKKALGMKVVHTHVAEDQSFRLIFLSDAEGHFFIELTELRDRKEPYDLGDNESHICFRTDDYEAAYHLHLEMGCICFENKEMGLYFIEDPDGYWLEITPIPIGVA
jgi:lactoylglutathione lyase